MKVALPPRRLEDYAAVIGSTEVEKIKRLAELVDGAKIVHVNATAYGGGVAEMLRSLVPLLAGLGVDVSWQVLEAPPEFFQVTKRIHNALQGDRSVVITEEMWRLYFKVNSENAAILDLDADLVVIHDPQPMALVEHRGAKGAWVWRCHIDLSDPNMEVWSVLRKLLSRYDAAVFTLEKYVPPDLREVRVYVRPPAIDPLTDKNKPLRPEEVESIVRRFDVDPERPIIGQVARFDPWKNPLGVVDVYRAAKRRIPGLQLVLIGAFAHDDPEGVEWYEKTVKYAGSDRDVHILTDRDGVRDLEVNAFQRAFTVALQLSKREGFGLAVTEALWKGTPVVATPVGGIPLQVIDGYTGYLVESLADAVERVVQLVKKPWLARILGHNGREHVRRNFLVTKLVKDYLRMCIDLAGKSAVGAA